MTNLAIVHHLRQQARLLSQNRDNLYRVRAYRRAAETIANLEVPVTSLSPQTLQALPSIGRSLAKTILHLLHPAVSESDHAQEYACMAC